MIAILVPVLGRAHQIKPLLQNIREATSTEHRVVFICSREDDALATCKKTKATTLVVDWKPDRADYAKKLGAGFKQSDEEWLFQGATDLKFHPGWDTAALLVARRTHRSVIGTNDLGNPTVKRGLGSTHTLFSRWYIDHFGGTVDDSGVIFSQAYDHQWTDVEFIETAKARRQFVFAKRSIVEHMHPHWNKGEMDDTYDKALRCTKEDQKMFQQRRRLIMQKARRR